MTLAEDPRRRGLSLEERRGDDRKRFAPLFGMVCGTSALAAGIDRLIVGGAGAPVGSLQAAGLGVLAGGSLGVLLAIVRRVVLRLPLRFTFAIWLSCLGAPSAWVLLDLDAWSKGRSGHAALAFLALATALVVTSALADALTRIDTPTLLRNLQLAVLGLSLFLSDLLILPGNYPAVHDALRVAALLVLSLLALGVRWRRPGPSMSRLQTGVLVALPVLSLTTLNVPNTPALRALLSRPYAGLALRAARRLLDVDFDGSSNFLGGGDCAPFNPHVGPLAAEVPGNGVDDNCLGGDAPLEKPPTLEEDVPLPSSPSPVSVVLVTVDALRADHLGVYGYQRPTSPRLDAWARDALVFEHAFTSGGITSIAIPSMLRGIYARRLTYATYLQERPQHDTGGAGALLKAPRVFRYSMPVGDPHVSLPRWLARRGMATLAVTGFGERLAANFGVHLLSGGAFDISKDVSSLAPNRRDDAGTTDLALELLHSLPAGRPFFLWVHYYGVHGPTERTPGAPSFGPGEIDGYDDEIVRLDRELGRFLHALDEVYAKERLAIVVTSDHGEELVNTQLRNHGLSLEDADIHIPLLLRAPRVAAGRRSEPVSLVDVTPTVLALTGTPAPPDLDGLCLTEATPQRTLLVDSWRLTKSGRFEIDLVAAVGRTMTLVHDRLHQVTTERGTLLNPASRAELSATIDRYLDRTGGTPRFRE